MKTVLTTLILVLCLTATAQENFVTFSGGYSFANIENISDNATGWRINGTYEYRPSGSPFAHGISVGYMSMTAEDSNFLGSTEIEISTIPIYYAPKYLFGNKSLEGFLKGALGMQFSDLKQTGTLASVSDNDTGFYGGLGVGGMKTFNEKFFINAEYEWAYMSNSFYKDGFVNSFMLGLGIKF